MYGCLIVFPALPISSQSSGSLTLSSQFLIVSLHFHSQPSNSPSLSLPSISPSYCLCFSSSHCGSYLTLSLSFLPFLFHLPTVSHWIIRGEQSQVSGWWTRSYRPRGACFAESPSGLTHTFYSAGCSAHSNLTPHALLWVVLWRQGIPQNCHNSVLSYQPPATLSSYLLIKILSSLGSVTLSLHPSWFHYVLIFHVEVNFHYIPQDTFYNSLWCPLQVFLRGKLAVIARGLVY